MREGHIAHAAREKIPKDIDIIVDGVAALDTHQDRDFACCVRRANFFRTRSKRKIPRMAPDLLPHTLDQIEAPPRGLAPGDFNRNPQRKKIAPMPPSRILGRSTLPSPLRGPNSNRLKKESLRGVGVGIEDDARKMNPACAGGNIVSVHNHGRSAKKAMRRNPPARGEIRIL